MSKQKKAYYTRFEGDKKRVNIYQLSKKVGDLHRQVALLVRSNNKLVELNNVSRLTLENLEERLDALEKLEYVKSESEEARMKGGFIKWLCNKLR